MSTEQIVSPQLDYSQKVFNHPSPLFVKISPQGTNSITGSVSGVSGPTTLQIPSKVCNLARSYLTFDVEIAAAGVNTTSVLSGNLGNFINRITISTVGSNIILADISNVGNYLEAVGAPSTKFVDLMDKASSTTLLKTSLAAAQASPCEDLAKVNAATNLTGVLSGSLTTGGDDAGAVYTGVKKLYVGTENAPNFISVRLPLNAFKHSIFSIDKDMYFAGEALSIDVYWEAGSKFIFGCTTASLANPNSGTPTVLPGAHTISNITLNLQSEQNIAITSGIVQRVMQQGLTLPIPVVWSSKQAITTSTSHNIVLNISKAMGNKCLAIFWAPYHSVESLNTCKSHTVTQLTTYNTLLNQVPILTNNLINTALGEHYFYNKDSLDKSAVQSIIAYNNSFCHFDNFSGMSLPDLIENGTVYNGIDLAQEVQQWQLNATYSPATSINHYVFVVCQKQLTIAPNSIMLS